MYRRCRRVERNDEFLNYMGITVFSLENYIDVMDSYQFMNTADLLLLNGLANVNMEKSFDEKLKMVINVCRDIINQDKKVLPSTATKSTSVFEKVQNACRSVSSNVEKEVLVLC